MLPLAFVGAICGGIVGLVPLRPLVDSFSCEFYDTHYGKLRVAVWGYLAMCSSLGAWLFVGAV